MGVIVDSSNYGYWELAFSSLHIATDYSKSLVVNSYHEKGVQGKAPIGPPLCFPNADDFSFMYLLGTRENDYLHWEFPLRSCAHGNYCYCLPHNCCFKLCVHDYWHLYLIEVEDVGGWLSMVI
jgi:hypothetical protein